MNLSSTVIKSGLELIMCVVERCDLKPLDSARVAKYMLEPLLASHVEELPFVLLRHRPHFDSFFHRAADCFAPLSVCCWGFVWRLYILPFLSPNPLTRHPATKVLSL